LRRQSYHHFLIQVKDETIISIISAEEDRQTIRLVDPFS